MEIEQKEIHLTTVYITITYSCLFSDVVDSSGLRFIYTSQLRQYDAGILETGVIVNGWQHLIPPNAESYLNYGECTSQCLEQV